MRTIASLIAAVTACYVLLAVLLYVFQERMAFLAGLPDRALEATPEDAGFDYADVSLETSDGISLHGWYVYARAGDRRHRDDRLSWW
jgi:hypothetical protein